MAGPQQPRADRGADLNNVALPRSADSWIEISSQPSSSSLSSAAEQENNIASGLRAPRDSLRIRRRHAYRPESVQPFQQPHRAEHQPASGTTSSQEEYSESEDTDSDPVLTSSNEALPPHRDILMPQQPVSNQELEHRECFTPQPNAFSHPPSNSQQPFDGVIPGSYFPSSMTAPETGYRTSHDRPQQRHSYPAAPRRVSSPSSRGASHAPHAIFSASPQPDHDAALRASLSTLFSLSSAAAARNADKAKGNAAAQRPQASMARPGPTSLRIVPESDILSADTQPMRQSTASSELVEADSAASKDKEKEKDKSKRRAPTARSSSKDRRATKKPRTNVTTTTEEAISPTLLTWVVSAGVLVFVSAISFSAGYVVGRDSGFVEGATGAGSSAAGAGAILRCGDCGTEVAKSGLGLRRWRWGSAALRA